MIVITFKYQESSKFQRQTQCKTQQALFVLKIVYPFDIVCCLKAHRITAIATTKNLSNRLVLSYVLLKLSYS